MLTHTLTHTAYRGGRFEVLASTALPITALGSVPKAQTQGDPDGTWNLEKLHLELKYLGRKLADARLQRGKVSYKWQS